MHDVGGGSQVQAGATCFQRQDEKGRPVILLEPFDQVLALFDRRSAMQDQSGTTKNTLQMRRQRASHFFELGENQRLLLARSDLLAQLAQPLKLPAFGRIECTVPEPVRGVIADLLGSAAAPLSVSGGVSDGWAKKTSSVGANRAISLCQLASSEAGATSRDGATAACAGAVSR